MGNSLRRPKYKGLVLWAFILVGAIYWTRWDYLKTPQVFQVEGPDLDNRLIPLRQLPGLPDRIWYSPGGELLASLYDPHSHLVVVLHLDNLDAVRIDKQPLTFGPELLSDTSELRPSKGIPRATRSVNRLNVSLQGDRVAYLVPGGVAVESIDPAPAYKAMFELPMESRIDGPGRCAIAWSYKRDLVLLDANGKLLILGTGDDVRHDRTVQWLRGELSDPKLLRGFPGVQLTTENVLGVAVAVSANSDVAIGSATGDIRIYPGSSDRKEFVRPNPGRLQFLMLDAPDRVFSVDFQGRVRHIGGERVPPVIVNVGDAGLGLVAIHGNRMAMAVPEAKDIRIRVFRYDLAMNPENSLLAVLVVTISALALLASIIVFVIRWVRYRRSIESPPPVKGRTEVVAAPRSPHPIANLRLPEPPEELVRACDRGECVLVAGPGLAGYAGLPHGDAFGAGLLQWAQKNNIIPAGALGSLNSALAQGAVDDVIQSVVDAAWDRREALISHLSETFLKPVPEKTDVYQKLGEIEFSAVLTSSFDELLEAEFEIPRERVMTPLEGERLLESYSKREFFVLKLFGRLDRPETLTPTLARYADAVAGNLPFAQFMSNLYFSRTFLMVGHPLETIEGLLSTIRSRGSGSTRHVALVEVDNEVKQVKANQLKSRFGIEVLAYSPDRGAVELGNFAAALAEATRKAREGEPHTGYHPGSGSGRSRLLSVQLENIGPFERLNLSLDPSWNVLVGDNGVGKTNILRAIAVGILGEDAQPYADRLIRAGAISGEGSITLVTESQTYRTILQKRPDGGAQVTPPPVRPMEREGWLAIGFPALRTVTWQRLGVALSEGRARPTPEDLLPLVRGDADPRMDKLKQWLINLDYLLKDERSSNMSASRYDKLLREFFVLVDKVTPGLKIAFNAIDARSKQVTVTTDDGVLPLEAVSQGTQSVMGWVGILLQRLYEIYGDEPEEPTKQYALVLMDEIDAHMHPLWQQLLAGTLKQIFPNTQFVATTHSPLMLAGLSANEVILLRREPGAREKISARKAPADLKGWRVDQILTSILFDMPGARDPETVELISTYTRLASQEKLEGDEAKKLEEAAAKLKVRLPSLVEREHARKAFDIIQRFARAELEAMSPDEKRKVSDEIKVQLQEGLTGSRRPM